MNLETQECSCCQIVIVTPDFMACQRIAVDRIRRFAANLTTLAGGFYGILPDVLPGAASELAAGADSPERLGDKLRLQFQFPNALHMLTQRRRVSG